MYLTQWYRQLRFDPDCFWNVNVPQPAGGSRSLVSLDKYHIRFADQHKYITVLNQNLTRCQNDEEFSIFVHSRTSAFDMRQVIRSTWMNRDINKSVKESKIHFFFLVGASVVPAENDRLETEAEQFNDIVMINMIDEYRKLSFKTIAGLLIARDLCPNARFYLKIDEDVVFLPDMLHHMMTSRKQDEPTVYGYVHTTSTPQRLTDGKWFTPEQDYPCQAYPSYASGPMYFLNKDATDRILRSTGARNHISTEDVMVSGILRTHANVALHHLPYIYYSRDDLSYFSGTPLLSLHGMKNPQDFNETWHTSMLNRCRYC